MRKWTATFALNRLFIVGLVLLVMHSYAPSKCKVGGGSFIADQLEQAFSGLATIRRALD